MATQGYPLSFTCAQCKCTFRVTRIDNQPQGMIPSSFSYCMLCGSHGLAIQDTDMDSYEIWAAELEAPIDLVKSLYQTWFLPEWRKYQRFFDFARAALNDEIEL